MAEEVRRRIDGARLAVAFAAAAVIAGGAAAATGAPSKDPVPKNTVSSQEVKNGSLLFKDFKTGQLYSKTDAEATFLKTSEATEKYLKKDVADTTFLKTSEATEKYLKKDVADATYLKAAQASQFVQGDGSVFTGVGSLAGVPEGEAQEILEIVGFVRLLIQNNDGPDKLLIENLTGDPLLYTAGGPDGGTIGAAATQVVDFGGLDAGQTIQLHSESDGRVATLTVSIVGGDDVFAQVLLSDLP